MIALKIIIGLVGAAFLLFGYFIFFRKKYALINGFTTDFKAGRRNEAYAKKVGLAEFVIGLVLLVVFFVLIIFA